MTKMEKFKYFRAGWVFGGLACTLAMQADRYFRKRDKNYKPLAWLRMIKEYNDDY